MHKFDVLVLGAGAAGLLCAIEAGKRGRRVAVLERADRIGKKILISGGGAVISPISIAARKISFPRTNISRNPRWPATRLRTSSLWSKIIAFPITKRRSGSSFVTAPRKTSSTYSNQSVGPRE